jgi:hypothetical protein
MVSLVAVLGLLLVVWVGWKCGGAAWDGWAAWGVSGW